MLEYSFKVYNLDTDILRRVVLLLILKLENKYKKYQCIAGNYEGISSTYEYIRNYTGSLCYMLVALRKNSNKYP